MSNNQIVVSECCESKVFYYDAADDKDKVVLPSHDLEHTFDCHGYFECRDCGDALTVEDLKTVLAG